MVYLLLFLMLLASLGYMSEGRAYDIYKSIIKTIFLLVIMAGLFVYCSFNGG